MSTIRTDFHIIIGQKFDKFGRQAGRPSVRVAKNKPDCGASEVAVAVSLELPETLFKRPSLQARIVVPDGQAPAVITPQIAQNIAAVVKEMAGITLRIEAPEVES